MMSVVNLVIETRPGADVVQHHRQCQSRTAVPLELHPSHPKWDRLYVDCIDPLAPCKHNWPSIRESYYSWQTASAQSVARKADAGKPRARKCMYIHLTSGNPMTSFSIIWPPPTTTRLPKGMSAYINRCNLSDFARLPNSSSKWTSILAPLRFFLSLQIPARSLTTGGRWRFDICDWCGSLGLSAHVVKFDDALCEASS